MKQVSALLQQLVTVISQRHATKQGLQQAIHAYSDDSQKCSLHRCKIKFMNGVWIQNDARLAITPTRSSQTLTEIFSLQNSVIKILKAVHKRDFHLNKLPVYASQQECVIFPTHSCRQGQKFYGLKLAYCPQLYKEQWVMLLNTRLNVHQQLKKKYSNRRIQQTDFNVKCNIL